MNTDTGFWIMEPFNRLFWIVTAAFLLLLLAASLLLRGKDRSVKEKVLITCCVITFVGFFVYKYFLSIDKQYDELYSFMGGFNWWGELPLHLCNINMTLIPIAVKRKSVPLMSFCFFIAPLGALMALVMPGSGFSGFSLLLPRMLGYFGTHYMVMIEGLALVTFGLYRPRFKDMPRTVLTILGIAFVIFLIDFTFRFTGLNPKANYFYLMETEGNFVLDMFYKYIPYPFLYTLPSLLILIPYMLLVTVPFALSEKKEKTQE